MRSAENGGKACGDGGLGVFAGCVIGGRLFFAQGGDGIGAHGAQGGEGAGGEGDREQRSGGGGQRDGIAGADAE